MKVTVTKRPSVVELWKVAEDIRLADRAEWYAASGQHFLPAASQTLEHAEYVKMAADEFGTPLVFWGCSDGNVWLFATDYAAEKAISLHKLLEEELQEMLDRWPVLTATADLRNKKHHDWLRWLGFTQGETIPTGPFDMPFIQFTLTEEDYACA